MPVDPVSGDSYLLLVPSSGRESGEEPSSLRSYLIRALIPSGELHPQDLITSQTPPPNLMTPRLECLGELEGREHKHSFRSPLSLTILACKGRVAELL